MVDMDDIKRKTTLLFVYYDCFSAEMEQRWSESETEGQTANPKLPHSFLGIIVRVLVLSVFSIP